MKYKMLVPVGFAAAALVAAGCSSGGSGSTGGYGGSGYGGSKPASHNKVAAAPVAAGKLTSAKIGGTKVLTDAKGFTLYWFAIDTSRKSMCDGVCAKFWPPVKGPAASGSGVKGTLATVKRSDGWTQATFDGHPLYLYKGDTKPGMASGNGINQYGGVWHEVTVSGAAAPASSSSSGSGSGGGGGW